MIAPQLSTAVRLAIVFFGGILVSKGLLTQEQLDFASDANLIAGIIGAIGALAAAVYGIWKRRPAGILADAASLPEVKGIDVRTPSLAKAVPSAKVQVGPPNSTMNDRQGER